MTTKDAEGDSPAIVAQIVLIFEKTDTELYVPVVTLSNENDTKLLEQLKSGFKKTIKQNKYKQQMTIQPKNNNSYYLIDPTFTNVVYKQLHVIMETFFQTIMYQTLK